MLLTFTTLAIVDDQLLFRKTLTTFLASQKNLIVKIQSSNVTDLLYQLKDHHIDVLVIDILMPQIDGLSVFEVIRSEFPLTKVIVLSMNLDIGVISHLLEMGIHAYISKSDEPDELLRAIRAVSEGKIYRNELFTEALYWNKQMRFRKPDKNSQLNEREKKIVQLIWEEKNNKEIADAMFLSIRSIEKIRQDIKKKLGIKSTIGLLKYAINQNIIKTNSRLIPMNLIPK
ncbi:response regulator transcription factor [Puia dinghuensis]|uniref:DNA-binding response regulator n=1 Tax=Puia dinghuensis TaxID=1792502 RepID=A0A8J2UB94_9BACT|nr:response regulator transcription factor [Puia dinghuensis]GGA93658.1 DNA-binding response regulator [Puia dinghuensis]